MVAPPRPGLALSSVTVVKRAEPVTEGALESSDPLRNGANRIVPFVGEPTFQPGETVSLFLVAYPTEAKTAALSLEFSRDGAVVGRSSVDLPLPDSTGRIPYVASIPTQTLPPGRYEVTAVVKAGEATARERTFFTIAPERTPAERVREGPGQE